jgi:hypothetical protein
LVVTNAGRAATRAFVATFVATCLVAAVSAPVAAGADMTTTSVTPDPVSSVWVS